LANSEFIGVNAAIANAFHHATGLRIRRLPIPASFARSAS
jgi:CO/xanthine dehydrogenase Mo-binding subunit